MNLIRRFEAMLLAPGQTNSYVYRNVEVMFSLPASPEAALQALGLYQPQRPVARLKRRVLQELIRCSVHTRVCKRGTPAKESASGEWDFIYVPSTVGIMMGSSEHAIARAIASYRGAAGWEVAKLGIGPEAREMLRAEATVLLALESKDVSAPRCLGLHERGDMTILRMPHLKGCPRDHQEKTEIIGMLAALADSAETKPLREFGQWRAICAALEKSATGRQVMEDLSDRLLRPTIAHGDFTSWNLLRLRDGTLMALDWEWGLLAGVPGLDLAHYFTQQQRLVRRLEPAEALRGVVAELDEPMVRSVLQRAGWRSALEPILINAAYKEGGLHQRAPEWLDVCLRAYASRRGEGEKEAAGSPRMEWTDPKSHRFGISVVTPSYKQVGFLECCAESVRDQVGDFEVEHLIHDGGTGPEFDEWAKRRKGAVCVSERDDGMYDAINRGFRRAKGDIVAWLNCDEQYLPGTLQKVADFFRSHPDVDILFGDVVLVDEVMTPLAYRRAVMPTTGHIRYSHLSTFSAATFVRKRVLDAGHFLQTRWKTIADAVWIDELLAAGYKAATLSEPLAVFSMLGTNLGQSELLFEERGIWEKETGSTSPWTKRFHVWRYRLERLVRGAYRFRKIRVSAYISGKRHRVTQERRIAGQWRVARDRAAYQKIQREGAFGGRLFHERGIVPTLVHAVCVVTSAFYIDSLVQGDAIKGPALLLASLLYLSFRSKVREQIWVASVYFLVAAFLLSVRPTDVIITRLVTFVCGALLSIFWSASLRSLEAWMRSTMMLVRQLAEPVVLTDRGGRITLANHAACTRLGYHESFLLGRRMLLLSLGPDGSVLGPLEFFDAPNQPSGLLFGMALEGSCGVMVAKGKLFAVGKTRFKMHAFSLAEAYAGVPIN